MISLFSIKSFFTNSYGASLLGRWVMIRNFGLVLSSLIIAGCAGVFQTSNSNLEQLESDIQINREIINQQQTLLDSLTSTPLESSDAVAIELLKTRLLLQRYIAQNTDAENSEPEQENSSDDKSDDRQQTRAEWLKAEGKVIVGGIENITFTEEGITHEARIDTGATSSSLDARDITNFERDGDRWVRFKLFMDGDEYVDLERPVIRWVRIFQSSGTDEGERRPIVEMAYQFGDIKGTAEFTLTDRSHLEYPALVGRNIMTDRMIVDVSDSHLFHEE